MDLINIVNHPNATIVDIREANEFEYGHATNAINIPLTSLAARLDEFRKMSTPIVLYCVSGNRSGQARQFLIANGFQDVYNGGGLDDMAYYQSAKSKAA